MDRSGSIERTTQMSKRKNSAKSLLASYKRRRRKMKKKGSSQKQPFEGDTIPTSFQLSGVRRKMFTHHLPITVGPPSNGDFSVVSRMLSKPTFGWGSGRRGLRKDCKAPILPVKRGRGRPKRCLLVDHAVPVPPTCLDGPVADGGEDTSVARRLSFAEVESLGCFVYNARRPRKEAFRASVVRKRTSNLSVRLAKMDGTGRGNRNFYSENASIQNRFEGCWKCLCVPSISCDVGIENTPNDDGEDPGCREEDSQGGRMRKCRKVATNAFQGAVVAGENGRRKLRKEGENWSTDDLSGKADPASKSRNCECSMESLVAEPVVATFSDAMILKGNRSVRIVTRDPNVGDGTVESDEVGQRKRLEDGPSHVSYVVPQSISEPVVRSEASIKRDSTCSKVKLVLSKSLYPKEVEREVPQTAEDWYCQEVNFTGIRLKRENRKSLEVGETDAEIARKPKKLKRSSSLSRNAKKCRPCSVSLVDFVKCLNLGASCATPGYHSAIPCISPDWKCTLKSIEHLETVGPISPIMINASPQKTPPGSFQEATDFVHSVQGDFINQNENPLVSTPFISGPVPNSPVVESVQLNHLPDRYPAQLIPSTYEHYQNEIIPLCSSKYPLWCVSNDNGSEPHAKGHVHDRSSADETKSKDIQMRLQIPKLKKIFDSVVKASSSVATQSDVVRSEGGTGRAENAVVGRANSDKHNSNTPEAVFPTPDSMGVGSSGCASRPWVDEGRVAPEIALRAKWSKAELGSTLHTCIHCIFSTPNRVSMREHVYSHTNIIPFMCGLCGALFGMLSAANLHCGRDHVGKDGQIIKDSTIDPEDHYTTEYAVGISDCDGSRIDAKESKIDVEKVSGIDVERSKVDVEEPMIDVEKVSGITVERSKVYVEESVIDVVESMIIAEKSKVDVEKKSKIDARKTKIDLEKSRISADKPTIDVVESTIIVEKSKIDMEKKSKIDAKKTKIDVEKSRISADKSTIDVEEPAIIVEKSKVDVEKKSKTKIDMVESKIDEKKTKIDVGKSRISAKKSMIYAVESTIIAEKSKVDVEKKSGIHAEKSMIDAVESMIIAEKSKIDMEKKSKIDAKKTKIDVEKSRISADKPTIDVVESTIIVEKSKIDMEKKSKIDAKKTKIDVEKSRISADKSMNDVVESTINVEKSKIDVEKKSKIYAEKSKINAEEVKIDAEDSQINISTISRASSSHNPDIEDPVAVECFTSKPSYIKSVPFTNHCQNMKTVESAKAAHISKDFAKAKNLKDHSPLIRSDCKLNPACDPQKIRNVHVSKDGIHHMQTKRDPVLLVCIEKCTVVDTIINSSRSVKSSTKDSRGRNLTPRRPRPKCRPRKDLTTSQRSVIDDGQNHTPSGYPERFITNDSGRSGLPDTTSSDNTTLLPLSPVGEISIVTCRAASDAAELNRRLLSPSASDREQRRRSASYACLHCDYSTLEVADMENHVFVMHPRMKRLICPICECYFCKWKPTMLSHFSDLHPKVKPVLEYEPSYLRKEDAESMSRGSAATPAHCLLKSQRRSPKRLQGQKSQSGGTVASLRRSGQQSKASGTTKSASRMGVLLSALALNVELQLKAQSKDIVADNIDASKGALEGLKNVRSFKKGLVDKGSTGCGTSFGTIGNPNGETSVNPNVGTSVKPNVGTSVDPNVGTSGDPNVGASVNPNVGTSVNPNSGTSVNPNVGTSVNPNAGTSDNPDGPINNDCATMNPDRMELHQPVLGRSVDDPCRWKTHSSSDLRTVSFHRTSKTTRQWSSIPSGEKPTLDVDALVTFKDLEIGKDASLVQNSPSDSVSALGDVPSDKTDRNSRNLTEDNLLCDARSLRVSLPPVNHEISSPNCTIASNQSCGKLIDPCLSEKTSGESGSDDNEFALRLFNSITEVESSVFPLETIKDDVALCVDTIHSRIISHSTSKEPRHTVDQNTDISTVSDKEFNCGEASGGKDVPFEQTECEEYSGLVDRNTYSPRCVFAIGCMEFSPERFSMDVRVSSDAGEEASSYNDIVSTSDGSSVSFETEERILFDDGCKSRVEGALCGAVALATDGNNYGKDIAEAIQASVVDEIDHSDDWNYSRRNEIAVVCTNDAPNVVVSPVEQDKRNSEVDEIELHSVDRDSVTAAWYDSDSDATRADNSRFNCALEYAVSIATPENSTRAEYDTAETVDSKSKYVANDSASILKSEYDSNTTQTVDSKSEYIANDSTSLLRSAYDLNTTQTVDSKSQYVANDSASISRTGIDSNTTQTIGSRSDCVLINSTSCVWPENDSSASETPTSRFKNEEYNNYSNEGYNSNRCSESDIFVTPVSVQNASKEFRDEDAYEADGEQLTHAVGEYVVNNDRADERFTLEDDVVEAEKLKSLRVGGINTVLQADDIQSFRGDDVFCAESVSSKIESVIDTEIENVIGTEFENVSDTEGVVGTEIVNVIITEIENVSVTEIEGVSGNEIENVSVTEIEGVSGNEIENVSVTEIEGVSGNEIENVSVTEIEGVSGNEIENVSVTEIEGVSGNEIENVSVTEIEGVSGNEIENVSVTEIEGVSGNEIENVSVTEIEAVFDTEIDTEIESIMVEGGIKISELGKVSDKQENDNRGFEKNICDSAMKNPVESLSAFSSCGISQVYYTAVAGTAIEKASECGYHLDMERAVCDTDVLETNMSIDRGDDCLQADDKCLTQDLAKDGKSSEDAYEEVAARDLYADIETCEVLVMAVSSSGIVDFSELDLKEVPDGIAANIFEDKDLNAPSVVSELALDSVIASECNDEATDTLVVESDKASVNAGGDNDDGCIGSVDVDTEMALDSVIANECNDEATDTLVVDSQKASGSVNASEGNDDRCIGSVDVDSESTLVVESEKASGGVNVSEDDDDGCIGSVAVDYESALDSVNASECNDEATDTLVVDSEKATDSVNAIEDNDDWCIGSVNVDSARALESVNANECNDEATDTFVVESGKTSDSVNASEDNDDRCIGSVAVDSERALDSVIVSEAVDTAAVDSEIYSECDDEAVVTVVLELAEASDDVIVSEANDDGSIDSLAVNSGKALDMDSEYNDQTVVTVVVESKKAAVIVSEDNYDGSLAVNSDTAEVCDFTSDCFCDAVGTVDLDIVTVDDCNDEAVVTVDSGKTWNDVNASEFKVDVGTVVVDRKKASDNASECNDKDKGTVAIDFEKASDNMSVCNCVALNSGVDDTVKASASIIANPCDDRAAGHMDAVLDLSSDSYKDCEYDDGAINSIVLDTDEAVHRILANSSADEAVVSLAVDSEKVLDSISAAACCEKAFHSVAVDSEKASDSSVAVECKAMVAVVSSVSAGSAKFCDVTEESRTSFHAVEKTKTSCHLECESKTSSQLVDEFQFDHTLHTDESLEGFPTNTHVLDLDAHALDQDAHVLDQDTHVLDQDTHILDQDAHVLDQDTHVLDQDTHVLDQDTHVLDQDTHGLDQDTHVLDQDTHVLDLDQESSNVSTIQRHCFSDNELSDLELSERIVEDQSAVDSYTEENAQEDLSASDESVQFNKAFDSVQENSEQSSQVVVNSAAAILTVISNEQNVQEYSSDLVDHDKAFDSVLENSEQSSQVVATSAAFVLSGQVNTQDYSSDFIDHDKAFDNVRDCDHTSLATIPTVISYQQESPVIFDLTQHNDDVSTVQDSGQGSQLVTDPVPIVLAEPESTSSLTAVDLSEDVRRDHVRVEEAVGISVRSEDCMCLEVSSTSDDPTTGLSLEVAPTTEVADPTPDFATDEELDVETYTEEEPEKRDADKELEEPCSHKEPAPGEASVCRYCSFNSADEDTMTEHLRQVHGVQLANCTQGEQHSTVQGLHMELSGTDVETKSTNEGYDLSIANVIVIEPSNNSDRADRKRKRSVTTDDLGGPEPVKQPCTRVLVPSEEDEDDVIFVREERRPLSASNSSRSDTHPTLSSANRPSDFGLTKPPSRSGYTPNSADAGVGTASVSRRHHPGFITPEVDANARLVRGQDVAASQEQRGRQYPFNLAETSCVRAPNVVVAIGTESFDRNPHRPVAMDSQHRPVDGPEPFLSDANSNRFLDMTSSPQWSSSGPVNYAFVTRAICRPIMSTMTLDPVPYRPQAKAATCSAGMQAAGSGYRGTVESRVRAQNVVVGMAADACDRNPHRPVATRVAGPPPLMHISELRDNVGTGTRAYPGDHIPRNSPTGVRLTDNRIDFASRPPVSNWSSASTRQTARTTSDVQDFVGTLSNNRWDVTRPPCDVQGDYTARPPAHSGGTNSRALDESHASRHVADIPLVNYRADHHMTKHPVDNRGRPAPRPYVDNHVARHLPEDHRIDFANRPVVDNPADHLPRHSSDNFAPFVDNRGIIHAARQSTGDFSTGRNTMVPPPAHSKLPVRQLPLRVPSFLPANIQPNMDSARIPCDMANAYPAHLQASNSSRNFQGTVRFGDKPPPAHLPQRNQAYMHPNILGTQGYPRPGHGAFEPPRARRLEVSSTNSCLLCSFQASDRWSLYDHILTHSLPEQGN